MQTVLAKENKSTKHLRETLRQRRMFILGVRADSIDSGTALGILRAFAMHGAGRRPARVFFTNVHTIHAARRDRQLTSCINNADLVLPDRSGLKIAGKLFGTPILENLNGTDLTPRFLQIAESEGMTVYLLGGQPGVVEDCSRWLAKRYPDLRVVGYHHGHFSTEEEKALVAKINAARPRILLVALGTPLQERWIARNAQHLRVGVCMGVGGLFDFLSGSKSRAPLWMRRLGIEWVYRFLWEPRAKWERVFVEIPVFLALIVAKRLTSMELRIFLTRKGVVQ